MRRYRARLKADPEAWEQYKAFYRSYMRERHRSTKRKAIEYKGNQCADCKGTYHPSVYDFHHLDPTLKDFKPSDSLTRKWDKVKAELDKCVMLCANCHRLRHHAQAPPIN
jgi:hypothetical protein